MSTYTDPVEQRVKDAVQGYKDTLARVTKQRDKFREALEEIGNIVGAPTAQYRHILCRFVLHKVSELVQTTLGVKR